MLAAWSFAPLWAHPARRYPTSAPAPLARRRRYLGGEFPDGASPVCGRRLRIFSLTTGSLCAITIIAVYSSIDKPWSVTAFASAFLASSTMVCLSGSLAASIRYSKSRLRSTTFCRACAAASSF